MKKLLILIFLFITGCETPPKPLPFPDNGSERNVNSLSGFMTAESNKVIKNRFDKNQWNYQMTVWGTNLMNVNHSQMWYLIHHADSINLTGEHTNILQIKNYMIHNGSTSQIGLTPNCYRTRANPCSDMVLIHFHHNVTK